MAGELYTVSQVCNGIRRLLKRPSDVELPQDDIRAELNSLCLTYLSQEKLAARDRRSTVAVLAVTPADIDYAINIENVPDFEEISLEVSEVDTGNWRNVDLVPLNTWPMHFDQPRVAASIYGSSSPQTPYRMKINMLPEEVGQRSWRLTYRVPMLNVLQYGERPPLPAEHIPMLEREAAILLAPQVERSAQWWLDWVQRHCAPPNGVYVLRLDELRTAWREYLNSGDGSQILPIRPFDSFRRRGPGLGVRPFVPLR